VAKWGGTTRFATRHEVSFAARGFRVSVAGLLIEG